MELRQFNTNGIAIFQTFLDSFGSSSLLPWPESALSDTAYSNAVTPAVTIERQAFATRFALAEYLHSRFEAGGFRAPNGETGLWAWIACFYFNEICPTSKGGAQKPGSAPRWIPRSNDWRRYYRHLVAGPYGIYRAHRDKPERAMALLCQRPGRPGDLVEQLASRQQIVTNPAIMELATDWFVDPTTGLQRKNANSKGPGGPRRLVSVLDQFDVTWDLSAMAPDDLRSHLPPEFKH